jgi:hypothetical protein
MKNNHINNKRTSQHQSIYRRYPLRVIILTLLLLAGLGIIANILYGNWRDEHNVTIMRSVAIELKDDLAKARPGIIWQDKSHCTVIEPRLFGESTTYSCTSEYSAAVDVDGQGAIDAVFKQQQNVLASNAKINQVRVLHHPQFMTGQEVQALPSYERNPNLAGSVNFVLKGSHPEGGCSLSYELDNPRFSTVRMGMNLRCSVDTKRTYFNPVETI